MAERIFPGKLQDIHRRIEQIDPVAYARTRNYTDGAVTRLSPYLSRGVISTRQVFEHLQSLDLPWKAIEKLSQELAWRDYWQQVWIAKGEAIDEDLRQAQAGVEHHQIPRGIVAAKTGITAVDEAIQELYRSGYMHNHLRMYTASLACNIGGSHWWTPARWMYYHLLDGDWASNALSWQWVAGSNANKKYYANQENINKYTGSTQKGSYLDVSYEEITEIAIPPELRATEPFEGGTPLPPLSPPKLAKRETLVYNYYNLDPYWHPEEDYQRVLLLEPSTFARYPVSQKCIDFTLALSKNIPGLKLMTGEFSELAQQVGSEHIIYKEHPTNRHYQGREEARDWMFSVKGYYPSFFKFWKAATSELKERGILS